MGGTHFPGASQSADTANWIQGCTSQTCTLNSKCNKCCNWACCSDLWIWHMLYQFGLVLFPRWSTLWTSLLNQLPKIIYNTAVNKYLLNQSLWRTINLDESLQLNHDDTSWHITNHDDTSRTMMTHHNTSQTMMTHHDTSQTMTTHHDTSQTMTTYHDTSQTMMTHHNTSQTMTTHHVNHHKTSWHITNHDDTSWNIMWTIMTHHKTSCELSQYITTHHDTSHEPSWTSQNITWTMTSHHKAIMVKHTTYHHN